MKKEKRRKVKYMTKIMITALLMFIVSLWIFLTTSPNTSAKLKEIQHDFLSSIVITLFVMMFALGIVLPTMYISVYIYESLLNCNFVKIKDLC